MIFEENRHKKHLQFCTWYFMYPWHSTDCTLVPILHYKTNSEYWDQRHSPTNTLECKGHLSLSCSVSCSELICCFIKLISLPRVSANCSIVSSCQNKYQQTFVAWQITGLLKWGILLLDGSQTSRFYEDVCLETNHHIDSQIISHSILTESKQCYC